MTIATDAGFVVGKYYKVKSKNTADYGAGIKSKWNIKFVLDDDTRMPLFSGNFENGATEAFVRLEDIDPQPLPETPAVIAGLVEGKKYKVKKDNGYFPKGAKVQLEDDGSYCPAFHGVTEDGVQDYFNIVLDNIKLPKPRKEK